MTARHHSVGPILLGTALALAAPALSDEPPLDYRTELVTVAKGYDGKTCWMHARAGVIPQGAPGNTSPGALVVLTLQKLDVAKSDVYFGLCDFRTRDKGKTWIGPTEHAALERRRPRPGVEVVPCDFWPTWHAPSAKLLGTGATFWYSLATNDHLDDAPSQTAYAVFDPSRCAWSAWRTLAMPDEPRFGFARAGCTQRVDLPSGDILLPIYFRPIAEPNQRHAAAVCRCRFDGETLNFAELGDVLSLDVARGLAEPSLVKFGDRFFLTLRNDVRGYVTTGDGLHFVPIRPWTFDDGSELGSYNTQQHWVTHGDRLYLVYTRRGARNDHVFRHRAPLFMARVDPDKLQVIRATERILIPERGAAVGNFGITDFSQRETWVIATECMMPGKPEQYGSDNSVLVVRLLWNR